MASEITLELSSRMFPLLTKGLLLQVEEPGMSRNIASERGNKEGRKAGGGGGEKKGAEGGRMQKRERREEERRERWE